MWLRRTVAAPLAIAVLVLFVFYGSKQGSSLRIDLTASTTPQDRIALRILPIGDSITEGYGSTDHNGWRLHLRNMLVDAGHQVDFVGYLQDGKDNPDNQHEGYGANDINQIYDHVVADKVLDYKPNLVLIHAGTNDVDRSPAPDPYETAPDRLARLIDLVLQRCKDAVLIIATIIQDDHAGVQARADTFNAAVRSLVAERAVHGHAIALVEQAQIGGTDLIDLIHPTDAGYEKMATNWFKAIQKIPSSWLQVPAEVIAR